MILASSLSEATSTIPSVLNATTATTISRPSPNSLLSERSTKANSILSNERAECHVQEDTDERVNRSRSNEGTFNQLASEECETSALKRNFSIQVSRIFSLFY